MCVAQVARAEDGAQLRASFPFPPATRVRMEVACEWLTLRHDQALRRDVHRDVHQDVHQEHLILSLVETIVSEQHVRKQVQAGVHLPGRPSQHSSRPPQRLGSQPTSTSKPGFGDGSVGAQGVRRSHSSHHPSRPGWHGRWTPLARPCSVPAATDLWLSGTFGSGRQPPPHAPRATNRYRDLTPPSVTNHAVRNSTGRLAVPLRPHRSSPAMMEMSHRTPPARMRSTGLRGIPRGPPPTQTSGPPPIQSIPTFGPLRGAGARSTYRQPPPEAEHLPTPDRRTVARTTTLPI